MPKCPEFYPSLTGESVTYVESRILGYNEKKSKMIYCFVLDTRLTRDGTADAARAEDELEVRPAEAAALRKAVPVAPVDHRRPEADQHVAALAVSTPTAARAACSHSRRTPAQRARPCQ